MMKNISKLLITSLLLVFFAANSFAQFTVKVELRPRFEMDNGYKFLPDKEQTASYFITQRSRMNFGFTSEKVKIGITLQDVRAWGDENLFTKSGIWGKTASIDLFEAWAELLFNKNASLKIGRQVFAYDDQRILCGRNWNQYGMTYDAVLFKYKKDGFRFDLGVSMNRKMPDYSTLATKPPYYSNDYWADGSRRMKTANFLYISKKMDKLNISLLNFLSGYQELLVEGSTDEAEDGIGTYFMNTVGPTLVYKSKNIFGQLQGFYQMGTNFDGKEVSAFMFAAEVAYKTPKFYLGVGYEYYSGQEAGNTDGIVHTFDLVNGARYKFLGNLNDFTLIDKHTKNGGLTDIFGKFKFIPSKKTTLGLTAHLFALANDVYKTGSTTEFYEKGLGTEIDLFVKHKIYKGVVVKAGYAIMLPSETLEVFKKKPVGETGLANWFSLMLIIKPTLFDSSK